MVSDWRSSAGQRTTWKSTAWAVSVARKGPPRLKELEGLAKAAKKKREREEAASTEAEQRGREQRERELKVEDARAAQELECEALENQAREAQNMVFQQRLQAARQSIQASKKNLATAPDAGLRAGLPADGMTAPVAGAMQTQVAGESTALGSGKAAVPDNGGAAAASPSRSPHLVQDGGTPPMVVELKRRIAFLRGQQQFSTPSPSASHEAMVQFIARQGELEQLQSDLERARRCNARPGHSFAMW